MLQRFLARFKTESHQNGIVRALRANVQLSRVLVRDFCDDRHDFVTKIFCGDGEWFLKFAVTVSIQ